MSLGESLRRQGVETSASGVVLGRRSTGAGEIEEVPHPMGLATAPLTVTGFRDDPESALAALLTALAALGLIVDDTEETEE